MGHKVHPKAFRLGVTQGWDAAWFAGKDRYSTLLREDVQLREMLRTRLREAFIDRVEIERSRDVLTVTIHAAKPGVIIGRGGAGIEELTKAVKARFFRGRKVNLSINVKEIPNLSLSAHVVGMQIAMDIEKRMPFRRIMKMAIERVMKAGAKGVKIVLGGRLNGAEIARREMLAQGSIPLHNLRADIDYASIRARTIAGAIGVKVWINRGEVFAETKKE